MASTNRRLRLDRVETLLNPPRFARDLWNQASAPANHRYDKLGNPLPMQLDGCGCGLCARHTHRVRVDDKGRLAIPASFRKQLPEGSYVSVSQDSALAIYPPDLWDALAQELRSPLPGPDQRALARTLYSMSETFEPDGQGRITLGMEQRRVTGIETPSTAVVIGMGSRVEIWPEARWDSYNADAQGRFTEFADRVISGR